MLCLGFVMQLRRRNGRGAVYHFVLHLEQVNERLVNARPMMGGGIAIDQLYVDAQPFPALNAALQCVAHVQVVADLPEIGGALVDEGGVVADHEGARNAR